MRAGLSSRHKPGEMTIVNVPGINKPEDCQLILKIAIQYLLFDKKIIPYPYCALNDVVNRSLNESNMSSRQIMFENLHKKKASAMIMKVDGILEGLDKELNSSIDTQVREVAFLIGPTISCPKEVYLFIVPVSYTDENLNIPVKRDIMRHIFMNEEFMKFTSKTIQRTNMYVLVKKPKGDTSSWKYPLPNYDIPERAPRVIMQLCSTNTSPNVGVLVDNVVKQINDLKVLELKKDSIVCHQNNRTNLGTQNFKDQDETNSLNKIGVSPSAHSICNPMCSVRSNNRDINYIKNPQKLTKDIITNEQSLEITANQESGHVSSYTVMKTVEENPDSKVNRKEHVKGIKEDKATSLNDDLMWYIASEYLPFFSQPKVDGCLPNKCVKR